MAILNPSPSSPSMFSAGTVQLLKIRSVVSEARSPILSSSLPTVNPGVPFSTKNALIPWWRFASSVMAVTITRPAFRPDVVKRFVPLIIYSFSFRTAVVDCLTGSDPAWGSVMAKAPIISPAARGFKYLSL